MFFEFDFKEVIDDLCDFSFGGVMRVESKL